VQAGWSIMTEQDTEGRRTYYTGSSSQNNNSTEGANFFLFNHRGDTVLVSDQSGSVLNELYYEAYGKVTDKDGMPINLTSSTVSTPLSPLFVGAFGIRYDRKTELSYMRFRWYSIEHLRFIRLDFLMGINRFVYVRNNPLLYMDVSGLKETTINNYLDMQTGRTIRTEGELSGGRYRFLNYDVIITPSTQHISAEPAGVDDFDDCFPLLDEKLGLLADPGQTIQAYIYADNLVKYHIKRTNNQWTRTWYSHWNDKYWHCLFSCLIAKRYDYDLTLEFGEAKEIRSLIKSFFSSDPKDNSTGPNGYCFEDMKADRIGARGGRLIRQNRYPKDCHHFCTERGYQPFLAGWK
jgi:RHS repeat-associated protein